MRHYKKKIYESRAKMDELIRVSSCLNSEMQDLVRTHPDAFVTTNAELLKQQWKILLRMHLLMDVLEENLTEEMAKTLLPPTDEEDEE